MTEQPSTVQGAVFSGLTGVLGEMGFSLSPNDLTVISARVTRWAFDRHRDADREEAVVELREALHRLWEEAGEPSTRQMSRQIRPERSHMTWHTALRCDPVPPYRTFVELVRYLDGDPGKLEELWFRAKGKPSVS